MNERTKVTLGLAGFCGLGWLSAIFPAVNVIVTILVGAVAAAALIGVITLLVLLVELHRPVRLARHEIHFTPTHSCGESVRFDRDSHHQNRNLALVAGVTVERPSTRKTRIRKG